MPHRYFTKEITENIAFLRGADAHHLAHVMRARTGEQITLCDGRGTDYVCAVRAITADTVELEILSSAPSVSEANVLVTLYIGYPKQDKLETVIQKAVELGAVRVAPFFSRYCVAAPKKEEQKNERYRRIAQEAAKQSGRGITPKISMPVTFREMLTDAAQNNDAALFCWEAGGEPLHSRLGDAKRIGIITGSEGGFSPEEAHVARAAGCAAISLGPRILRCETAPIAALAAVMALTGNLQ